MTAYLAYSEEIEVPYYSGPLDYDAVVAHQEQPFIDPDEFDTASLPVIRLGLVARLRDWWWGVFVAYQVRSM